MGMIIRAAALAAVGATLVGCTAQTIAQKALGGDAIKVASAPLSRIVAPGIYRISQGKRGAVLSQICSNDFLQQNALKALTPTQLQSDATIEDDNPYRGLFITVPPFGVGVGSAGGTLSPRITVDRAAKYKISTIAEGYTGNLADYMINNVASNCRRDLLRGDLLFVRSTAEAEKLYRVTSGGLKITGTLGPGTVTYDRTPEEVAYIGSNVTFGVTGERRNISR